MIDNTLSTWIAQSESWQTFIEFDLPEESIAKYPFLKRSDDFYISLFGELYAILEKIKGNNLELDENENLLSLAKGLEIYSLRKKSEKFSGVNKADNILFSAGLYYLAGYSGSAYILANIFENSNYERSIDRFIHSFLTRRLENNNSFNSLMKLYLDSGDISFLNELLKKVELEGSINDNPYDFSIYYLAEAILNKFKSDNIWYELLKHGKVEYWIPYVKNIVKRSFPIWDFFPSQKIALEKGILNSFKSFSLQTPTSSGKTSICELIIYNEFKQNPNCRILYLAPFRALAAELKQSFGKNLSQLGIKSKTIYGGNIPTTIEKELVKNVTLLISTPEKFMALENSEKDFIKNFNLIICDEGHLLDDENRGLSYELLLSRLKRHNEVNRKIIFISAIIPNIHQINNWLGGSEDTIIRSKYRPTEIEFGFIKNYKKSSFYLEVNPLKSIPQKYILYNFLTEMDFKYEKKLRNKVKSKVYDFSSIKTKSVAIALKALNTGSVALFTPSKGGNSGVLGLTTELIKQLEIGLTFPKPIDFIKKGSNIKNKLLEYFKLIFGSNYLLTKLINYGALFHNGDLPQCVREVIEDAIRNEEIKLVICTNTISEGVNLPIRTIVINSAMRYDGNKQVPIRLRDLKNLTGRAGRAGKETKGLIIVINPKDFPVMEKVIKDLDIEEVKGYLYYIIKTISKIVIDRRLILTNEILDSQDLSFKELLDAIDISLIDLFGEEVSSVELEMTIQGLIDETFVRLQVNQEELSTLTNLIKLRGERIKPFIDRNEFKYLKQCGTTIRTYEEIQRNVDLDNKIWENLNDPLDEAWLEFIIKDIILNLSHIKYKLKEFNIRNNTNFLYKEIKSVIMSWINGSWFQEISSYCNIDINIALQIVNNFIVYDIQSAASAVIKNAQLRYQMDNKNLSETVINFPQYLVYGLKTNIQLHLIELGFSDRTGIIVLSEILKEKNFIDLVDLKNYLSDNQKSLLDELIKIIPVICFEKMKESFNFLRYT